MKEFPHLRDGEVMVEATSVLAQPSLHNLYWQSNRRAIWHTVNHAREPIREVHEARSAVYSEAA